MCNATLKKILPQNGSQSDENSLAENPEQVVVPDSHTFKQKGNDLLKENKPKAALKAYASALNAAAVEHVDDHEKAVLLSNRAYAHIKCNMFIKVWTSLSPVAASGDNYRRQSLKHVT